MVDFAVEIIAISYMVAADSYDKTLEGGQMSFTKQSTPTKKSSSDIVIGIHSGMGPLAGYAFSQKFQELISKKYAGDARGDKAYPTIITYSDSQTPPRNKNITNDRGILQHLQKGMDIFRLARADFILAPCNTLMHFRNRLEAYGNIPYLDIISSTANFTKKKHPSIKKVGLLSTGATAQNGLYHKAFDKLGIEVCTLTWPQLKEFDAITDALKAGKHLTGEREELEEKAYTYIAELEKQGVEAIILGCTELPLLLQEYKTDKGTFLISSIEALAQTGMERLAMLEKRSDLSFNKEKTCNTP